MPVRLEYTVLPNPPSHYSLGSIKSRTFCILCPPEMTDHYMVLQEAFCRSPGCQPDCSVVLRVRKCQQEGGPQQWLQHSNHTPRLEGVEYPASNRQRLPNELIRAASINIHRRPFTVLQNFRQANPELASGITLRQVANLSGTNVLAYLRSSASAN